MINWYATMQQTFEFYEVDPNTWTDKRKLTSVTSCQIKRDMSLETLGSATIDSDDLFGEAYVRVYLVVIQNGIKTKLPLGTFLVQTSSSSYNGKIREPSLDAYTPLLELKDVSPALGYAIKKNAKVFEQAALICEQYCRAPSVPPVSVEDILEKDFIADPGDTWLSFLHDLLKNVKHRLDLDEMGKIMFAPTQDVEATRPVWTYTDDEVSILYPDIKDDIDIYGIPNTVEVVYSGDDLYLTSLAVNDDPNSIVSTVNRGRTVFYRSENPEFLGVPHQSEVDAYAEQLLKDLSTIECTVTYKHGYNGVRVGDCVRFDCPGAGLNGIKARVTTQSIDCTVGCPVSETAVYKKKLLGV